MTSTKPGVHKFAILTACATFLLLIAGALVTSNDAGLSVPDWPLSYGSLAPPMVGGIFYEHGHRMVATLVGILTIILAVWLWRSEPRRWVRRLGLVALGAVIAQGVLGGVTVLFYLPVAISVGHATLAQIFFSTVVSIAVFTSPWWQGEHASREDSGSPALRALLPWTIGAIFLQLILGAAFRHKGVGIAPHLIGAAIVAILVFWTAGVLRQRFPSVQVLRRCARLLQVLISLQLALGAGAWWSRIATREFPQPVPIMVGLTVAHTVVGALTLASTLAVALVCYRLVRPARSPALASEMQGAAL